MVGPSFWLGVLVGLVMLIYDAWYNSKRYALSRWAKRLNWEKKIHVTGSQWVNRAMPLPACPWNFRLRGRDSDLSPGYSSLLSPDSWFYSFEVMEVENCGGGFAFSFLFFLLFLSFLFSMVYYTICTLLNRCRVLNSYSFR